MVPVWREVLADQITPVAAFARLVGDGDGFLFESVERERWGRWSFIGRDPSATIVARDGVLTVDGQLPDGVPLDQGVFALVEALLAAYRSPPLEDLPPLHGGLVGYLGYEVVREIESLPDPPAASQGLPDAVISVIGSLAAFDHWKQRVVLLANAVIAPGASVTELDAAYDDAVAKVETLMADGARALDEPIRKAIGL